MNCELMFPREHFYIFSLSYTGPKPYRIIRIPTMASSYGLAEATPRYESLCYDSVVVRASRDTTHPRYESITAIAQFPAR